MFTDRDRTLAALTDIVRNVNQRTVALQKIADLIKNHGEYRWVGLYDVDHTAQIIENIVWSGPGAPTHPTFSITKGLTGTAVSARKTINVGDVAADPRYLTTLSTTRSEIIVPVIDQQSGDVVGTIDVESETPHAFDADTQHFLEECSRTIRPLWSCGDVQVIVASGTMGSGKTTILSEASDILAAAGIVHAAIDLDTLGITHIADADSNELAFRNLASVWSNYRAAGVVRLLLAAAVMDATDLHRIREAVPATNLTVCRLTVSKAIAEARIRTREPGMFQEKFVARVSVLDTILDDAKLENFSLHNDDASVTDVAREMLTRAGWL